ncbi:MAG: hypothetical protein K2J14_04810, partial [Treponemataceae bacterium]|nr:hypothetical protein [Treponemataceae bacterium]
KEVTVRMTILKDNPNRPDKPGETGMFIDYVEFTKTGSQAGQGEGSETPEPGAGKADWTGFTMVDSADKLDFTANSYEYKSVCYIENRGVETRNATIEIVSSDEVNFAYKLKTEEYYDDASYNNAKEEIGKNPKYSYDDSTRTITKTYSEVDTMTFAEFKDDMCFPKDEIDEDRSWTYTDKKLGVKDGVIQMAFTENYTRTDDTSKHTYYYTITLTPQK